jgi:transposase
MESNLLFTAALGLQAPWQVAAIRFEPDQGQIHFDLTCASSRLNCPVCDAADQPIHDRKSRRWQHLHFFQYQAFLHAPVPRVKCQQCGKVTQVPVPWARPGSGFTLLMDALVLALAQQLPVAQIARLFGVTENRLWRAIGVHVEGARATTSYADVVALGVDEKHVGRTLGYVTLFHDPLNPRVIGVVEGRKAETFATFKQDFVSHDGQPDAIDCIAMDLAPGYQAGARQHFPQADICFDAFHLAKLVHDALDAVRRAEVKQERFREIHQLCRLGADPEPLYRAWISWARRSRLEPFKRLGKTLKQHLPGILAAYRRGLSNAVAENLNSQIQAAIVRARGFKSLRSLTHIIFLTTGKLENLPANPLARAVTG